MRTAKNEFDKLFIGNSEHTESGTSTSPPRKIPIKENTDGKIPDTPSGKINFSNPIDTNKSVLRGEYYFVQIRFSFSQNSGEKPIF